MWAGYNRPCLALCVTIPAGRAVEIDGVRRVERCDCWREGLTARLLEDARIPPRYRRCELDTFVTYPNEKLLNAVKQARRFAETVPGVAERGSASSARPASARRTWPWRCCGGSWSTQRRARPVLRHARSAARHPQHLQPARSHGRDGHPPSGHGSRPARPRRHRVGKDVRVGRRDDEPHRQHALQRAAAHDLHVELRGHAGRRRPRTSRSRHGSDSEFTRVSTRCASSSSSTAPTTATLPTNGVPTISLTLCEGEARRSPHAARAIEGPRPSAVEAAGRRRAAIWAGPAERPAARHATLGAQRQSGSAISESAICNARPLPPHPVLQRPSATTATSTAACSKPALKDSVRRGARTGNPCGPAARAPAAADTIFFGGGTPSLLDPDEIGRLIAACRDTFAVDA